jgi:nucleotide-binding universal stress UspA family protein
MLVLGSHGYGRFMSAVMGSTAMRIASMAEIPLLVVR